MASKLEEGGNGVQDNGMEDLLSSLSVDDSWFFRHFLYSGFWLPEEWVQGTLATRQHMVARNDDILIASLPKSGTTWLKALVFAVIRRGSYHPADPLHPLRHNSPHECVEFLEHLFSENRAADLEAFPSPRILSTHIPYSILPESIKQSDCRVVYLCRDHKDALISYWHFRKRIYEHNEIVWPLTMAQAVELSCSGIEPFGPYWDNILEFWNESQNRPDKVLFLRYEDMKEDPARNVRRLAAFLGKPFSVEEEGEGVVRDIVELCSFRSLKEMEVNQGGIVTTVKTIDVPRNSFFRQGEVGDWVNHLTPDMVEKMDSMAREKFQVAGLKINSN